MRETSSCHTYSVSFSREYTRDLNTGHPVSVFDIGDLERLAECLSLGTLSDGVDSDFEPEEKAAGSKRRNIGKGKAEEKTKRKAATRTSARPVTSKSVARPAIRARLDHDGVVESELDESSVPVFRHTFEMNFSVDDEDEDAASHPYDFLNILARKCAEQDDHDQDSPIIFNLGMVYPYASAYLDHVFVCTTDPLLSGRKVPPPQTRILALPSVLGDVKDADHDFHNQNLSDILVSAYNMQKNKRAKLSGPLHVIVASRTPIMLFTLRIEITVSLCIPRIFEPLTTFKRKGSEEEEAQRRVLTHVFCPTKENEAAQPVDLLPKLLPFQRRSVGWLLTREGKHISESGHIVAMDPFRTSNLPLFWERVNPIEGKNWYMNRVTGQLLPDAPPTDEFLGGILAEEPGLGKTLESIALILLNPGINRNPLITRWDPVGVIDVKEVKARTATTLIVTPASLAQQWVDELKLHSPSLKVLVYEGWTRVPVPITAHEAKEKTMRLFRAQRRPAIEKELSEDGIPDEDNAGIFDLTDEEKNELKRVNEQMTWCDFVQQYDVCITTYHTLQQDLGVARAPVVRPRREVAKYVTVYRDRSPLVMVEWNRVIMDEVQMVGGGKTEEMVSLIPRLSSFAVSGTPARASVDDLIHVIKTVKAKVQDELSIPQQRRYVVPIELGKVEMHVYDQNREQALMDLGFDERGVAAFSGWQIDVNVLRMWLRKLRGICTHPQVGQLAKQNDRLAKAGSALKTISENMKDQNWRTLMGEKKSRIQILIKRAQLIQHDDERLQKDEVALQMLLGAKSDMDTLCMEICDVITEHNAKGEILKEEAAAAAQRQANEHIRSVGASMAKDKHRQRDNISEDSADDELPKTPAGDEHRNKKYALQARLRECHVVLHQLQFLLGDIYHVLGETYSSKEDDAYAAAEELRKRLLKSTEQAADLSIAQLKLSSTKKTVAVEEMKIAHCENGGKKSEDLFREANGVIDILNKQSALLFQWRARIIKLLTESLSASDGEDADGQEYARTLDTQGEAETFLQAYAALLADRREMLVTERTALAAHDVRERKIRNTGAALRAQAGEVLGMDVLQPEHEVLQKELTAERKDIRKDHNGRAIKSISVDLQGIASSIRDDKDPERITAKEWNMKLKALIKGQTNFHDKLESDMVQFRKAFNDRIQYFRQLQELSDTVRDVEWEGPVTEAIAETYAEEDDINKNTNKHHARRRYLENLADNDDEDDEDNCCILCRSEFTRGFITQCAHVYCEGCLKTWFARKEGKVCPVCRVIIDPDQLQRITMKGKKIEPSAGPSSTNSYKSLDSKEAVPRSKRVIEYNSIDQEVFENIEKIDCLGSYGTKVETLVRHLLYLDDVDPGCKSIVFSAWADSLYILQHALTENGIKWLRVDQRRGKQNAAKVFKTDPQIRVLLLHGERENAGLNVTAMRIETIARIDRMGQTRSTEVYCYYAENTVERNILDLAAKRGLSLYTKDHAVGTLEVTSFDMDNDGQINSSASKKKQKGQKGDFISKTDDMLAILFPHLFEDVEYLVSEDEDGFDPELMVEDEEPMNEEPLAGSSTLT
ncbi:hypothetical protein EW145_g5749 [Phellinidium pouzarii]|uniref:RING-type domain-containing protein n=1 Tax=Phellinidium pouzarii TaxID=167371 RepID=A0A4S4KZJ8_9AGAM|nr:hypothetical protein EW145_g5749 [Phellinidium pouzarii]